MNRIEAIERRRDGGLMLVELLLALAVGRGRRWFPPESDRMGTLKEATMHTFSAVIERCPETGLLVGYVPGFPGAHSQGESVEELRQNLQEVIAMLLEDGEPRFESHFLGMQQITVPA